MKSALLKKDVLNKLINNEIDSFEILITDDPHLEFVVLNKSYAHFYNLQQGEAVENKSQYQKGDVVFIKESVKTSLDNCIYLMKIKKVEVIKEKSSIFFKYKVKLWKK